MADNGTVTRNTFMHNHDLSNLNEELVGFISSIRELEEYIASEELTGDQVKSEVAEMFPPAVLFSPKIQSLPVVYRSLRDWLNAKGAALTPHSSHCIIMTLATTIYTDSEDTNVATEIFRGIMARCRTRTLANSPVTVNNTDATTTSTGPGPSSGPSHGEHKLAHNVAMRFKNREDKFSGDIGEAWNEYVLEYQQVCRD